MNKKGIEKLLSKIKIGDDISVSTRRGSFSGEIGEIYDDWFLVDGYVIEYHSVWWHSKEN
ncbi:hypothetical protein [Priestia flexa]|uniref:hypothetical protein n=1 Tax=Priestia flexa TaxID=86664 RepID=UPI0004736CB3|nr:hypothetical protein [Priestia flexa]